MPSCQNLTARPVYTVLGAVAVYRAADHVLTEATPEEDLVHHACGCAGVARSRGGAWCLKIPERATWKLGRL